MTGLSVIIPNYKGHERVALALQSLVDQTASKESFEAIVVVNGGVDSFSRPLEDLSAQFSELRLRVVYSPQPGASRARNIGLAMARENYCTFLDDDDWLGPTFIESALSQAAEDRVVVLPIEDISEEGSRKSSDLGMRINALGGEEVALESIPWVLGFNAAKVAPSSLLRSLRFNPDLRSGEDVAFWAGLLEFDHLRAVIGAGDGENSYNRVLRPNSISRQTSTFHFAVEERLAVIEALRSLGKTARNPSTESLVNSQFNFVISYLMEHPDQMEKAILAAGRRGLIDLPWDKAKSDESKKLVVSYCFPPYADPAANVIAKRISAGREPVDVIFANMARVRNVDSSTKLLVLPWTRRTKEINSGPSFSGWEFICEFAQAALETARNWTRWGQDYEVLYTRAMWSGSHVAGALIKNEMRGTKWIAEFSDPMRFDSRGTRRDGAITQNRTTRILKKMLSETEFAGERYQSHFELTELVTLGFADELIFTNENQLKIVASEFGDSLSRLILEKSTVKPQSTLDRNYYSITRSEYALDVGKVNIGYFGNFYENRSSGKLIEALSNLPASMRSKLAVHFFCNNGDLVAQAALTSGVQHNVHVNGFVDYLEFLSLSSSFDVLFVEDSDTRDSLFDLNPFLPSKYSDYLGSGVKIWAAVESGSPLSSAQLDYVSEIGSSESIQEALFRIVGDFG